ncbi:MAG: BCCT family transporter [Pseudomonadota bacterium]
MAGIGRAHEERHAKPLSLGSIALLIHGPIFGVSAALLLAFVGLALAVPGPTASVMAALKQLVLTRFDWVFMVTAAFAVLVCFAIALSPMGRIRLGGEEARPRYSNMSWLAMLFAAGVGTGMMFYGTAEPAGYYSGWAGSPLGASANTPQAERLAFAATLYHWGLTPWAIYALAGLALAYFHFNKGLPLTMRSGFSPLLGRYIRAWPGFVIDIFAVLATVFGLATTLGFGATLAISGLGYLFGADDSQANQILLICVITAAATVSVALGLDKGIRRLSTANMWLAAGLLVFVLVVGPSGAITATIGQAALDYPAHFLDFSRWRGRDDTLFFQNWTLLYWAWWIAWAPFVGMFIARISYGRSIRTFLLCVILVPTVVGLVWFSAFGKTAISQMQQGVGALAGGIDKDYLVIWQTLEALPLPLISSLIALTLLIIFFVTSSDSGSLVVDTITAGGREEAPVAQRVFWALLEGGVAIALLVGGGAGALGSMQNAVIVAGLPFAIILVLCGGCLLLALMKDQYRGKDIT